MHRPLYYAGADTQRISYFLMAIIVKNPGFCNVFFGFGLYIPPASTTLAATPAAVAISAPARV